MVRIIARAIVAGFLVAAAAAVLLASPLARPAVAVLPSFLTSLPAHILAAF